MESSGGRMRHTGAAEVTGTPPSPQAIGLLWFDTASAPAAGAGTRLIETITADTTLTTEHGVVKVDASGGPITVTLPAVSVLFGLQYDIKKIDASTNTVTIDGNGSDTIDRGLEAVLTEQDEAVTIVGDAVVWSIL